MIKIVIIRKLAIFKGKEFIGLNAKKKNTKSSINIGKSSRFVMLI